MQPGPRLTARGRRMNLLAGVSPLTSDAPVPGNAARGHPRSWAVPATVSGERLSTRPQRAAATGDHPWEGGRRALTREPEDRPVRVAHAWAREAPGTDNRRAT